jgi:proteasome beta subunit
VTLIVAYVCQDGVILTADSQETELTGNVRSPVEKIRKLTGHAMWGSSGSTQIASDLAGQFGGFKDEDPRFMAQKLAEKTKPILERHYANHIVFVPGLGNSSPATSVLACGSSPESGPWITEIDAHCQYSQYTAKGYHAIGSGAEAAQYAISVLSHISVRDNPLEYGKVVACRVMDTIIATAAYHVSQPVRMWTADTNEVALVDDTEMTKLREAVQAWKETEKDALLEVLARDGHRDKKEAPPPPEF